MSARRAWSTLALALGLASCSTQPPAPSWQLEAHGATARYEQAWLSGADRAAQAEFDRARAAVASTGRPDLVGRVELVRCALQLASLEAQAVAPGARCEGFEALRADAAKPELAYAAYLSAATLQPEQLALLPPAHRALAGALAAVMAAVMAGHAHDELRVPQALTRIEDPLARLVAAGVVVRAGRGSPQVLALAVDTASRQGWRRPLLAWLGAQAALAQQAGDETLAKALRRRMDLVAAPR